MKNTTTFDDRGVVLSVESRGDPRQHTIRNRFPDGGRWDETYIEFGGYFGCYGPHVFRAAPALLDSLKVCLALLENLETPPSNTKSKCISDAQEAIAMAEPIVPTTIIPVAPPVSQVREPEPAALQVEEEQATLRIADINAAIKPFKIDAAGLAEFGIVGVKNGGPHSMFKVSDLLKVFRHGSDALLKAHAIYGQEKAA